MSSASSNDAPQPSPGLPPVQPPSGRFIVQLFVVPGLIITFVVLVLMVLNFVGRRDREPAYFLQQLDSDNADIRWRGASDLAQILKRPEPATLRWKADPKFALDIAERLEAAFQRLVKEEARVGALVAKSKDKDKHLLWRQLRTGRDHVSFLASALGQFHAPVGAPVLCAILKHDESPDLNGNTLRRRKALLSLNNMGDHLKGFARIPAEHRDRLIAGLKEEATADTPRAGWARTALYYLDKDAAGSLKDVVKVDETLVFTADAEDRLLRELTAVAFTYWDGDRAEATLLKLSRDTGRGTLIRVEEND